jgi:hypothetical protein
MRTATITLILNLLGTVLIAQTIVADHTVVDKYKDIPPFYLSKVKEMWVILAGESHSTGYRLGCKLLNEADTAYKYNTKTGTPEAPTSKYLRLSATTWGDVNNASGWMGSYGEEDWFTSPTALTRTESHLTYCNTHNLAIAAMGFGWCWDMTADNGPGGTIDPVYKVRWAGRSAGGPQGSLRWGLDAGDSILTGNSICMDSYLKATTRYSDFCRTNNYPTRIFFTTGPVDGSGNLGENGYQRELKHNHIRNYVKLSPDRILFDYADILCWSNAGQENLTTWKDAAGITQSFQAIHPDNMLDLNGGYTEDGDHIGQRGALRLAKAMWWMLARMAGWNGISTNSEPGLVKQEEVRVYPNPFENHLYIERSSPQPGSVASICNLEGQLLTRKLLGDHSTELEVSHLKSGIYLLKISGKNEFVQKIIKR